MALDRPLGISSPGDCPAPQLLLQDQVVQTFTHHTAQFTTLARQILSTDYLSDARIDNFTDQLLGLEDVLHGQARFSKTWLNKQKIIPSFNVAAQAASMYAEKHNFLTLLNRRRVGESQIATKDSAIDLVVDSHTTSKVLRGRERVLESCRASLHAFEFFNTRLRPTMTCWTMPQQAFKAAKILAISMLETGDTKDLTMVEQAYSTFSEMERSGVRRVAATTLEKLGDLLDCLRTGIKTEGSLAEVQEALSFREVGLEERSISLPSPLLRQGLDRQGLTSNNDHDRTTSATHPGTRVKAMRRHTPTSVHKPKAATRNLAFRQRRDSTTSQRYSGLWMNEPWQLEPMPLTSQENNILTPLTPATIPYSDADMHFENLDEVAVQQNLAGVHGNRMAMPASHSDTPADEKAFDPPSQSGFSIFHRSPSFARLCASLGSSSQPMTDASYNQDPPFQPQQQTIRAPVQHQQNAQVPAQPGVYHPTIYAQASPLNDTGYTFHPSLQPSQNVQAQFTNMENQANITTNQANLMTQSSNPTQKQQEEHMGYCWPVEYIDYADFQQ